MTYSPSGVSDYYTEVARGNIAGSSIMSAMGERKSIQTTTAGEDIWLGNELTPAPTSHTSIPTPDSAGEQMTIVSESGNDAAAGTGARTVEVHYIDAAGAQQSEVVELNGTGDADTVATDIRYVNDFHVVTAGTGLVTAGNVKIYKKGTVGLVYNMIAQGGNKSLVPNRMVPVGYKLVIKSWHTEEAQDKRVNVRLRATSNANTVLTDVFLFKDTTFLKKNASGALPLNILVPALAIVKVSGWAIQANAEVGCSWWGELIAD